MSILLWARPRFVDACCSTARLVLLSMGFGTCTETARRLLSTCNSPVTSPPLRMSKKPAGPSVVSPELMAPKVKLTSGSYRAVSCIFDELEQLLDNAIERAEEFDRAGFASTYSGASLTGSLASCDTSTPILHGHHQPADPPPAHTAAAESITIKLTPEGYRGVTDMLYAVEQVLDNGLALASTLIGDFASPRVGPCSALPTPRSLPPTSPPPSSGPRSQQHVEQARAARERMQQAAARAAQATADTQRRLSSSQLGSSPPGAHDSPYARSALTHRPSTGNRPSHTTPLPAFRLSLESLRPLSLRPDDNLGLHQPAPQPADTLPAAAVPMRVAGDVTAEEGTEEEAPTPRCSPPVPSLALSRLQAPGPHGPTPGASLSARSSGPRVPAASPPRLCLPLAPLEAPRAGSGSPQARRGSGTAQQEQQQGPLGSPLTPSQPSPLALSPAVNAPAAASPGARLPGGACSVNGSGSGSGEPCPSPRGKADGTGPGLRQGTDRRSHGVMVVSPRGSGATAVGVTPPGATAVGVAQPVRLDVAAVTGQEAAREGSGGDVHGGGSKTARGPREHCVGQGAAGRTSGDGREGTAGRAEGGAGRARGRKGRGKGKGRAQVPGLNLGRG